MEEAVARLKKWCEDNYENGADTMVECWDTEDYERLLKEEPSEAEALERLKQLASIYSERQADARYYRENF